MTVVSQFAESADTLDSDPSELVAQLSNRIVILQQQVQSLSQFPANKDAKRQRSILQQQIRTLYQQIFLREQQHSASRQRGENYLSMALSVAAHAAHARHLELGAAG